MHIVLCNHAVHRCADDGDVMNTQRIAKQVIRDIKRILQQQKGTTTEREYLFAHMNQIKGRMGWI